MHDIYALMMIYEKSKEESSIKGKGGRADLKINISGNKLPAKLHLDIFFSFDW